MKTITQFFQGLSNANDDIKECADLAYLDMFPRTTTKLAEWFDQFGLRDSSTLTEQQKRDKLAGAWSATGSLSPNYLQGVLQGQGFDVYVHEWWEPGTQPAVGVVGCPTTRNPFNYLQQGGITTFPGVDCGEDDAACGEAFAECGNGINVLGYPLVNKITQTVPAFLALCGEPSAQCGEPDVECGSYLVTEEVDNEPVIPADPAKWPYFVYIGAQSFPDLAVIPAGRRDEFEELLLKYVRASNWIGVLVTYS